MALRVIPYLEVRDRSRHGEDKAYSDHGKKEPKKSTKGYDLRVVGV